MDHRIVQIEEKIAHLEKHVTDLDQVVRDYHEQLVQSRDEVKRLEQRLDKSLTDEQSPDTEDEPPPHW